MSDWRAHGGEINDSFGDRSIWQSYRAPRSTEEIEIQKQIISQWKTGGETPKDVESKYEIMKRAQRTSRPPTIEQFMSQVKAEKQREVFEPVQTWSIRRSESKRERSKNSVETGLRVESKEDFQEKLKAVRKFEGIGLEQNPALHRRTDHNSKGLTDDAGSGSPQRDQDETQARTENPSSGAASQHQPDNRISDTAVSRDTLHPSSTNVVEAPPLTFGLKNITMLLDKLGNPQDSLKVVHVAGTNGKGSVCAYLTSCLTASKLTVGQFTSPHLIDRWDCLTINGTVIPTEAFLEIERGVTEISNKHAIGASSFETMVACALMYFSQEKVDIAVIEAGMGGLLDATNVFKAPLVSVITHIAIDHTQYLGSEIEDIARHKAGIIKPGSAVVTVPQQPEVLKILRRTAHDAEAHLLIATGYWRTPAQTRYMVDNVYFQDADPLSTPVLGVVPGIAGSQQSDNVACAVKALDILRVWFPQISEAHVQSGIASASVPGRMEWIRCEVPEGRLPMLLDGAHNYSSCEALAKFVGELRRDAPVTWVVSFSRGRDVIGCLDKLVQVGDSVACVEFGEVDGMSWVKPVEAKEIAKHAEQMTRNSERVMNFGRDIRAAIRWAVKETKERRGMLVGTGSLYLVGEIYRLKRDDPEFII